MTKLSFNPKQITKKLLNAVPERARDILIKRYGLGGETDKMTLEAIGKEYKITRERVRQIEEHSLDSIRKTKAFTEIESALKELEGVFESLGSVLSEEDLLEEVATNGDVKNHIHFLLVLGDSFYKMKEDDFFTHRWTTNKNAAEEVHTAIKKLYDELDKESIVSEQEIVKSFLNKIKKIDDQYKNEEVVKRWLNITKKINKNPLGEWGRSESPNINVKGMRDYAFLVIRRHGSPIHFREVAETINKLFNKKAHVATCHNELIKDPRFVLVGRGLYALSEWGYMSGVVRDVISKVLEKNGPLTKEDIIDKVMKERYVKENTILVNLQNPNYFKKDKEGYYHIA